ncbi:MAG TPA: NADP-dependent oxidoreductase [Streptosporangiaceae bacterium]|jgi:NADPH:quinone reductase-like Zn-dependent oxidoreductase|nr:NADP-dependent oxidoreductase [Streptosporangiaceae bacterium]
MKAVVAAGYGPPEQYTVADVPVPRPGPGQLQVRIAAASINPADVRLPSGEFRDLVSLEFPHVPGNDFAGTVTEVGAGVTAFRPGDDIFGQAVPRALRALVSATRPSLSTGSLAQYAVFEADTPFLAHRPAGLSVEHAAALATTGLTARALMATAKVRPGETALVVGATGGVGTALVPLLAAAKARVIATATADDADILRGLGADKIIGYAEAEYPAAIDIAFNLALPSDRLTGVARAVRPGGRLVTITYPVPEQKWIARDDVRLYFVLDVEGTHGEMRDLGELAGSGELPATIGRRYSLDDGAQACVDFIRRHTTGKLVVTM